MNTTDIYILRKIGLIIIGDEILLGRRSDKHFSKALDYFKKISIDISWIYFLGDDLEQLVDHFRAVRARGEDCFTFGGIGATPDDLTRQAMAEAHNQKLIRHPEAVRLIENQFGPEAYPNRILMAELPQGAGIIPNQYNNIPGFYCGRIHCLPGFPEMAWSMLDWVVENRYEVEKTSHDYFKSITVLGAKESELIELLTDNQQRFSEVKFSSLPRFPKEGEWHIEIGARGRKKQVEAGFTALLASLKSSGFTVAE